jgi:predicted amidohydrolase YtcJ
MIGRFTASGAKALHHGKGLFAALKRCATRRLTQKLHAALESHLSQRTRKMGHPAFLVVFVAMVSSAQAPAPASPPAQAPSSAQAPAPSNAPAPKPSSEPEKTDTRPKADVIYVHANVYTGVPSNTAFSSILREDAIAVRGERIQAVGKAVDVMKLKGPQTEVVDLGGHFVMPGFNDAQVHLAEAGLQKLTIDLTGVKTLDELRERVKARVANAQPNEWILGGGWDETIWPVQTLPSRWDLDEVTDGHPVLLDRVDGHLAVANTRALQLASITLASRDPEGGKIDRDANGQPTGILRGTAQQPVRAAIPQLTHPARRRAIEVALADLAENGVTSVQDYSAEWENFIIYEELEKENKLTVRISESLPFDDVVDELKVKRDLHPQTDLMLHAGMVRGFVDGSLGGHTAALLEPYSDDPKQSGLIQYEAAKLNEMTKERVLAGFQLGLHASGDKAIQMALDAFAEAEKAAREQKVKAANGGDDFRLRVEHAEVTTPAQLARFKELKVIASMRPSYLLTDMHWARDRLGQKRAATSYALGGLANKSVTLAFGTDDPVEPVSPFRVLYAAVTRKSENGKQEYFPEQKLTMDQAIAAYTTGSAFAEFEEKEKGKLAPGMLADFVVLDRDITAASAEKELATKVLRTVVGGKTVYEAK